MAIEIERRFLVATPGWESGAGSSSLIRQAYLSVTPASSIRIRIKNDVSASLTVKSAKSEIARSEFEYPVPLEDAEELLTLRMGHLIEKRRFIVIIDWARWEVDVFSGIFEGLVIAELELDDCTRQFDRPSWLGE